MKYAVQLGNFGKRNDSLLDDIDQALSILLFTRPGERIYDPLYGCELVNMLDAPEYFLPNVIVSIAEAVGRYEKRIDIHTVDVGIPEGLSGGEALAQGKVRITVTYSVRGVGARVTRLYYSDGTVVPR